LSKLYRGPSRDAFYQVSVHLAKRFQKRKIKKISQSETRIACGSHRNLVESISGRSSIKFAQFVPIDLQTWPPHAILVSDWLISE
jgi:hypothetical protein